MKNEWDINIWEKYAKANYIAQKMFSIKDFFSKYVQIRRKLK